MKLLAILPAVLLTGISTNVAANLMETQAEDAMMVKDTAATMICLKDKQRYTLYGNNAVMVNTNKSNQSRSACMMTNIAKNQPEINKEGLVVVKSAAAPRNCLINKQRYTLYGNNAVMVNTNKSNQCKN